MPIDLDALIERTRPAPGRERAAPEDLLGPYRAAGRRFIRALLSKPNLDMYVGKVYGTPYIADNVMLWPGTPWRGRDVREVKGLGSLVGGFRPGAEATIAEIRMSRSSLFAGKVARLVAFERETIADAVRLAALSEAVGGHEKLFIAGRLEAIRVEGPKGKAWLMPVVLEPGEWRD